MSGVPRFARHSSKTEELLHVPEPKVIGEIDVNAITDPKPATATWTSADGTQIDVTDIPPPPWVSDPKRGLDNTDARNFVDAPDNVELRWLNPREVAHYGMRNWQAVPAEGDARFTLLNKSMRHVDNTIRKGLGPEASLLSWMYKAWVTDLRQRKAEKSAKRAASSRERFEAPKDEIQRGSFGRYVKITSSEFPSDTSFDGRRVAKD